MKEKLSRREKLSVIGSILILSAGIFIQSTHDTVSPKGGKSPETAVIINAGENITLDMLTGRISRNCWYQWDDGEKIYFKQPDYDKARTAVPGSKGIHLLTVSDDIIYTETFTYKVE